MNLATIAHTLISRNEPPMPDSVCAALCIMGAVHFIFRG